MACINDIKCIRKSGSLNTHLEIELKKEIKEKAIKAMLNYAYLINDLEETEKIIKKFI